LSFLPTVSASTPTIQQVLTAGQVATTTIETTGFIKTGGTSSQFLKADGSVDSNVYGVGNALTTNPLSQFAATTSSQLAGVISDETGSGALVFGTSPTFITKITTPLINGTSGTLQIGTTDLVNIGNKTTTSQRLVRIGQDTAWLDIGSLVGSTSNGAIFFNQNTPSISNSALYGNTTGTVLNATGTVSMSLSITPIITVSSVGTTTINPVSSSSGAVTGLTFTAAANTNQTLGTNIPNFRVNGANKQWATGTVTNQYWNYLTANTVSFVGASTITSSYGLYVEAATTGTNATITNNYAAGFSGRVSQEGLGSSTFFGSRCGIGDDLTANLNTGFGADALLTNIVGAKNCAFGYFALRLATGSFNVAVGTEALQATTTGAQNVAIGNNTLLSNQTGTGNTAVGDLSLFQTTGGSNTGVGKNTLYDHTSGTFNTAIGWNTGRGIITGGSNTIIGAQVTGLSSTLANNVIIADGAGNKVLWFNSANALISDLKIDTTTGIKIGTTNLQKLSFWNATPIVQPTTAVASATVVSGAGGTVKHDDTFDGYTLEKVVRALRNVGLLA
jgi:hypothetical protein